MSENAITIWDIVKSISEGTEEVFDEEIYNPFIVTMALGQHADLVLTANEVNQRSNLTKRQHYDFLFNLVRKKKRFSKWQKRLVAVWIFPKGNIAVHIDLLWHPVVCTTRQILLPGPLVFKWNQLIYVSLGINHALISGIDTHGCAAG